MTDIEIIRTPEHVNRAMERIRQRAAKTPIDCPCCGVSNPVITKLAREKWQIACRHCSLSLSNVYAKKYAIMKWNSIGWIEDKALVDYWLKTKASQEIIDQATSWPTHLQAQALQALASAMRGAAAPSAG